MAVGAHSASILPEEGALVTKAKKLSDKEIRRYWVEVRDIATGAVRQLPLTAEGDLLETWQKGRAASAE
jgi:hypothetical protein